jgi:hypothetical protein
MGVMMNEEEIWQKIRAVAADYANRGEPLFRDNYYSLWVSTAGNEVITIQKNRGDATSISPIEDDGGRITTFTTKIDDFMEFMSSYELLEINEYEYKERAYHALTRGLLESLEVTMQPRSTEREALKDHVISMLSDSPIRMADIRESILSKLSPSIGDLEKTGHGRKRWETRLQNAIGDLKQEGKIGHLSRNRYVSPISCPDPLNPEDLWLDIVENSETIHEDEIVCSWENYNHGTGNYFIESVTSNKIIFKRDPLCENKKINQIQFDKKRVFGMANSLNAVGGIGTRVTIGGNREEYSELLVSLSSMIEFDEKQNIVITDTVVDSIVSFDCNKLNSEKDLRKRALKPGIQRQGSSKFRKEVLKNYGSKCAISGTSVVDTIQAAHIRPYNGPETNHPANGIALRSDIHRLFDLGKIRIDPRDLRIHLHPEIEIEYREICCEKLDLENVTIHPNKEALELMWNFEKNIWF